MPLRACARAHDYGNAYWFYAVGTRIHLRKLRIVDDSNWNPDAKRCQTMKNPS